MRTRRIGWFLPMLLLLSATAFGAEGDEPDDVSVPAFTEAEESHAYSLTDVFTGSLTMAAEGLDFMWRRIAPPAEEESFRPDLNYKGPSSRGYRLTRQFTIKPTLAYSRVHNNNVYGRENGRQQDNINRISTGFSSHYALDPEYRHRVSFAYGTTLEYFDRFSREDHADHYIGTHGTFKFNDIRITARGRWSRTFSRDSVNLPNPDNISEKAHTSLLAEIPLGAMFAEGDFQNQHVDNQSLGNSIYDRNEFWSYARYGLKLSPRQSIYLEYGHLDIQYPNFGERDGYANQYGLGVRAYPDNRTYVTGRVAYQAREYQMDESPDFFGVVADLRVQRKFGDLHGLTIDVSRGPYETTYLGQNYTVQNSLGYEYRLPVFMADLVLINTGRIGHNNYAKITQTGGDWETRRDWVWGQSIGLEYYYKRYATLFLRYNYSASQSNTKDLDIEIEQVTYGIRGVF